MVLLAMPMCERRTRWPGLLGPLGRLRLRQSRLQRRLTRLRCAEEGPCIQTLDPHYVSSMRMTNTTRIKSSWIFSFWERFRQWLAGIVPVVHIFTAVIILVVIIVPVVHIFTAVIILVVIIVPVVHIFTAVIILVVIIVPVVHIFTAIIIVVIIVPCCPYLHCCHHSSGHHHPCCPYLHCCHHSSGHHRPCCPYLHRYHHSGHHRSLLSISSLLSSY